MKANYSRRTASLMLMNAMQLSRSPLPKKTIYCGNIRLFMRFINWQWHILQFSVLL